MVEAVKKVILRYHAADVRDEDSAPPSDAWFEQLVAELTSGAYGSKLMFRNALNSFEPAAAKTENAAACRC